jgi:hypothetical protein
VKRIDAYAAAPHHLDHLVPIWKALPHELRGRFGVPHRMRRWARSRVAAVNGRPAGRNPLLIATWAEVRPGRRYVYVEHGVGQSYGGEPPADSAPSDCRCNVDVIVCPSERVASRNRLHHPHAIVAAVGSPRMDEHHLAAYEPEPALIAYTFHWHSTGLVPEADWAWPHWRDAIAKLARGGGAMIGTAHPHAWQRLRPWWRTIGVPCIAESADVFRRAHVLVADNTSLLVEFASLGRPVILLDAPWYRPDVHHGARFWEWADMGLRAGSGDAADLSEAIYGTLCADPCRQRRAEVVAEVFGDCDGHAAHRAAEVIADYLRGG